MSSKKLRHFCPLPFTSLFTFNNGAIKICCDSGAVGSLAEGTLQEVWNADKIQEVRQFFLQDLRHPICQKCWSKEDQGLQSARQSHEYSSSYGETEDLSPVVKNFPKNLSLRLGNSCNYKCIMCQPLNSTRWNEDLEIYNQFNNKWETKTYIPAVDIESIEKWLEESASGPQLVYFVGGEPHLAPEFRRAINYLAKKSFAKSLVVRVFSNLSVDFDWLLDYAPHFRRLEISASIDGIGEHYNYIRYPGDWKKIEARIIRLVKNVPENFVFDFFFVVMSINIFNLPHFHQWTSLQNWGRLKPRIFLDIVNEPDYLDIAYLSENKKKQAQDLMIQLMQIDHGGLLIKDEIENIIKHLDLPMVKNQKMQQQKLFSYIDSLDQKRQSNGQIVLQDISM